MNTPRHSPNSSATRPATPPNPHGWWRAEPPWIGTDPIVGGDRQC
jgi:hypothetical protein